MNSKYKLYVVDTETTGLSAAKNDPIEISIFRMEDDVQKTWFCKPLNIDSISEDALRVNKHKLEDLKGLTKFGKERYLDPNKVAVEIENWLMEDMVASEDRLVLGQNSNFDKAMLLAWWEKLGSKDTFPFNQKYTIDTMQIEFINDLVKNSMSNEGYSLFALGKKYGVKNEAAHSAASDVRATVSIFRKQIEYLKKLMLKNG